MMRLIIESDDSQEQFGYLLDIATRVQGTPLKIHSQVFSGVSGSLEPPTSLQPTQQDSAIPAQSGAATANPDATTAYDNDSAEHHMGVIWLYILAGFGVMGLAFGVVYLILSI